MKILIVEDSKVWTEILTSALDTMEDAELETAATFENAAACLARHSPDCIVLDLNLPDSPPARTYSDMMRIYGGPVVVVTGEENHPVHPYVLSKNFSATPDIIRASVNAAVEESNTRRLLRRLHPRAMFSKSIEDGTRVMTVGMAAVAS